MTGSIDRWLSSPGAAAGVLLAVLLMSFACAGSGFVHGSVVGTAFGLIGVTIAAIGLVSLQDDRLARRDSGSASRH